MRKPIAQRIKELEERKRALQSRLGKQERAQDTRRKILLGSFVLERLACGSEQDGDTSDQSALRHWLATQLPAFLRRDADRALFADLLEQCRLGQGHGVADGNAQRTNGNQADVIGDNEP